MTAGYRLTLKPAKPNPLPPTMRQEYIVIRQTKPCLLLFKISNDLDVSLKRNFA